MTKEISALVAALSKREKPEQIDKLEFKVACSMDDSLKCAAFYQLPTKNILDILKKTSVSIEQAKEIASKMSEYKHGEALLILDSITFDDEVTLKDCLEIISCFKNIKFCETVNEQYSAYKQLPERDYEGEIRNLNKEIENLKKEIIILKKPSDFEKDIFIAVQQRKLSSLKYSFDYLNANFNVVDKNGVYPILYAAKVGDLDIVQYLIKCKAKYNVIDKKGSTLLHYAAGNGHLDIVKYLIENLSMNMEIKDNLGNTPLHKAALSNHLSVVKYLFEHHAKAETTDNEGSTPLHEAAWAGHLEVVKYLIDVCGVNINAKDNDGASPLYMAVLYKQMKVIEYLVGTGKAEITKDIIEEADSGDDKAIASFLHEHTKKPTTTRKTPKYMPRPRAIFDL